MPASTKDWPSPWMSSMVRRVVEKMREASAKRVSRSPRSSRTFASWWTWVWSARPRVVDELGGVGVGRRGHGRPFLFETGGHLHAVGFDRADDLLGVRQQTEGFLALSLHGG
jgi:hypothetical protein